MATSLQRLLVRLAVDAELYAEYLEDRTAVMGRFDLDPEEIAAIESRDVGKIVARLSPEMAAGIRGTGQVVVSHKALIPSMVEFAGD